MSENTTAPVASTVKVDLLATRSRINPTAPEANRFYSSMNVKGRFHLLVTMNSEGRIRAAMSDGKPGYRLGDTMETKKYGDLKVIGQVSKAGRKTGIVPDEKLPLRVFSV